MRRLTPGNAPALVRAFGGSSPVVVTVAGGAVPVDEHGSVTIRRQRGSRDPIGTPATCSLSVAVDTPPDWKKGDPLTVKLTDAALAQLYPGPTVRTNLMPNPSAEGNLNLWAAANGTLTKTAHPDAPAGSNVVRYAATGNTGASTNQVFTTLMPVTAGRQYYGEVRVRGQAATVLRLIMNWYTAASGFIASTTLASTPGNADPSGFAPLNGHATAPANAAQCRLYVVALTALPAGPGWDVDAALVEDYVPSIHDGAYSAYFDGDSYSDGVVTYAWTGTPQASTSTATDASRDLARYRFTGRVTDLTLTTGLTSAVADVIATGYLASLSADVGDTPWPVESARDRVERVLAAAKAADPVISYAVTPDDITPNVPARDVDATSSQSLIEALSETVSPKAGIWERRDGTLYWSDGFSSQVFPSLGLGVQAVAMPLTHAQAPQVNTVTVTPSGKPTVGQLLYVNRVTNPSGEVNTNGWYTSSNATITRDTVVFQAPGVASIKATAPGAGQAGIYTIVDGSYDGALTPWSALVRRSAAGPMMLWIGHRNAAGAITAYTQGPQVQLAANTWTRLDGPLAPAPAGTVSQALFVLMPGATAGQSFNVDRVAAWDAYTGEPPPSLTYFDGASTATTEYTFAWEGTAHGSRSYAKATATTPTPSYTYRDPASIAEFGVLPDRVSSLVDIGAAGFSWGQLVTRAQDQVLTGGWAPPELRVDVLALLDGRVDYVNGFDTPAKAASAALRAELGSARSLWLTGDEPGHIPYLGNSDVVTSLAESITPHRWLITTAAERTF